jgi:hypothetical protein
MREANTGPRAATPETIEGHLPRGGCEILAAPCRITSKSCDVLTRHSLDTISMDSCRCSMSRSSGATRLNRRLLGYGEATGASGIGSHKPASCRAICAPCPMGSRSHLPKSTWIDRQLRTPASGYTATCSYFCGIEWALRVLRDGQVPGSNPGAPIAGTPRRYGDSGLQRGSRPGPPALGRDAPVPKSLRTGVSR